MKEMNIMPEISRIARNALLDAGCKSVEITLIRHYASLRGEFEMLISAIADNRVLVGIGTTINSVISSLISEANINTVFEQS